MIGQLVGEINVQQLWFWWEVGMSLWWCEAADSRETRSIGSIRHNHYNISPHHHDAYSYSKKLSSDQPPLSDKERWSPPSASLRMLISCLCMAGYDSHLIFILCRMHFRSSVLRSFCKAHQPVLVSPKTEKKAAAIISFCSAGPRRTQVSQVLIRSLLQGLLHFYFPRRTSIHTT